MLKSKICEDCKASFVPELKNQTKCNECLKGGNENDNRRTRSKKKSPRKDEA